MLGGRAAGPLGCRAAEMLGFGGAGIQGLEAECEAVGLQGYRTARLDAGVPAWFAVGLLEHLAGGL